MAITYQNGTVPKNEEFIRDAVNAANVNALRLALYQLTGDPELSRMDITKSPVRGGALLDYVLSPDDEAMVRDRALKYLLAREESKARGNLPSPPQPPSSKQEYESLIRMFHGDEGLSPQMITLGYEELAFEGTSREVTWTRAPSAEKLSNYHVVIIGAGLNGIVTAINLKRLRIPFVLIDRQTRPGGTWLINNYPDVRVDTLGFGFQYKFERGHIWKEMFPSGEEIRSYLEGIAIKHGVMENMLFEREVVAAQWLEGSQTWELTLKLPDGSVQRYDRKVNSIISAVGLFSTPQSPNILGIRDYKGHIWHTTQWDHTVNWRSRDIAIIGNGSSGAQLVPGISEGAATLGVYQRTPQWMAPSDGYRSLVPEPLIWLIREMPFYANWNCYTGYVRASQLLDVQVNDLEWRAKGGLVNPRNDKLRKTLTDYIKKSVKSKPGLTSQLIPSYAPLVRRLVMDSGYYEALLRDNTELITTPIERITANGIRTKDGIERHHDIIVLACGFQPTNFLHPVEYIGRNGITLNETWKKDGARSFLGMMIPGYPNLFTLYGPNHQPRGGPSILSWAEIWARYAVRSIVWMLERDIKSMDVAQATFDDYNSRLDAANKKLLWESDGYGYFVNEHGRQAVNTPWTVEEYYTLLSQPINPNDFVLEK